MDYRTYVSRSKISSCLLVIFLFFAFPIFAYASNTVTGSFSGFVQNTQYHYCNSASVLFSSILPENTVPLSISVTFTVSGLDGSRKPYFRVVDSSNKITYFYSTTSSNGTHTITADISSVSDAVSFRISADNNTFSSSNPNISSGSYVVTYGPAPAPTPTPGPTPEPTPEPVSNFNVYVSGSTGAYPRADIVGYQDSYAYVNGNNLMTDHYVNLFSAFTVFSDYDLSDVVNISLDEELNGTYRIYADIPIEVSYSPSKTIANFSLVGGYIEIVDCSSSALSYQLKYNSGDYSYHLYVFGDVPVINGYVGSISLVQHLTFGASHSEVDGGSAVPRKVLGLNSLPYLTYLSTVGYVSGSYSLVSSSTGSIDAIQGVTNAVDRVDNTLNKQHQEEVDAADKASSDVVSGVGQLTGVLSSWEIVKMPFTFVSDFAGAITSEGSTGLTFPSFTLMGYTLWPSYTFDLEVIKEQFPLLYNSLHTITGIMVVGWFIHYLWRKWSLLTGDDTPEGN